MSSIRRVYTFCRVPKAIREVRACFSWRVASSKTWVIMDKAPTLFYRRAWNHEFAKVWAPILGLAVCTGLLDFLHEYIYYRLSNRVSPWAMIAHGLAVWWLSYIILVVIALLMAHWFVLAPDVLARNLGIHFLAALLLAYGHTISNALLTPVPGVTGSPLSKVVFMAGLNFPIDFVSYWAIIGLNSAFSYYAIARRNEERSNKAALHTRTLIETSLDPLVTINRGGQITDANRAAELVTGVGRGSLIGSDVAAYFTEPEKARAGCDQIFAERTLRNFPLTIRSVSGGVTDVLCNASVFKNEAGEVEGAVAAARDITDRKQRDEQLLQSQKLEAIGQLAGGVAHDFNNIIGVILGYAELAQARTSLDDPLAKHIGRIRNAAERGAALTRQLLAFSRKQPLQPEILNLNDIVIELAKMLVRLVGENIEVVVQTSDDLGSVKADPIQIQQVLINLAINARDAMPNGGKLVISIANTRMDEGSPVPNGDYVMISVSDTGVGMDEEIRSHIFEPFFTTKGFGKGTGLGLSIIYGIIRQSGGHIWIESEPGKGSTFKIWLPRVSELPEPGVREASVIPIVQKAVETILLVEDETELANMTREVLEESGFRVLQAASAEEALDLSAAFKGKIDLLLTDVVLRTGMDGTMLAERLRASRPDLKVIYMSGYNEVMVAFGGKRALGAELLEKPFTTITLRSKLREILDRDS